MDGEEQQLRYWLALLQVKGVGPVQFRHLWQESGGLERLFEAPPAHLPEGVRQGLRATDWEVIDSALRWREQPDCHILTLEHPAYPPQLKEIHDAPPLLFVRGDVAQLSNPQLAMVGSRNPGVVGRETAHDFGRSLAAAGLVITSGLAQGIDTASHQGALAGDGQSVAVFGTGPDRVYPAQNRELAHAIVAGGGALVSEYSPGVGPQPANFPRRNRIISGLSLGTLVVEAALRSGSLITARYATEQGREVFAIPGSIHNPLARGCHQLIRQGAKLVESAQDILEELAPQLHAAIAAEAAPAPEPAAQLDEEYRQLLSCLDGGPSSVDRLVQRSGLTADAVSSMLLLLELQGYVVSTAGGYTLAGKRP